MSRVAWLVASVLLALPAAIAAPPTLEEFPVSISTRASQSLDEGENVTGNPQEVGPKDLPRDPTLWILSEPERLRDPRIFLAFILSQGEHQGLWPPGLVAQLLDAGPGSGLATKFAYPLQDANDDGVEDLILSQWDVVTLESTVSVVSGKDGSPIWQKDNLLYYPTWPPRLGGPTPQPWDNAQPARDVDGDRVGDLLVFGFAFEYLPPPPANICEEVLTFAGSYRMLSGRNGTPIWTEPYAGSWIHHQCEPDAHLITNLYTGLAYVDDPTGPLVVYKLSTIQWIEVYDPTRLVGASVRVVEITDHIRVLDAVKGELKWERVLLPTENPDQAAFRWITGAAELDGKPGLDVVLDELFWSNPQFSEIYIPVGFQANYGRGMALRALRGEDGETFWQREIFKEPPFRADLPTEEPYPYLVWTRAQILEDMTGDGVPEPIALYLTADLTSPGTINGVVRTNFAPLDGATGQKLWKEDERLGVWHKDRQYIGWGFAASLNTPGHQSGLLAIGTADHPFTDAMRGGRFPPKDVHLAVFKVQDGSMVWNWDRRFSQDSYVAYHMTLDQYLHALAPYDWNGDGVRDLVTPAQYHKPSGKTQTLLANAEHSYEILSGVDGDTIQSFRAWGSNGQLVSCGRYEPTLTVVTGHSRRWDVTRFDGLNGTQVWRQPIYNDIRMRPATAGVDLVLFNARCLPMDGRELVNVFHWTLAAGRDHGGHEMTGMYGILRSPNGALEWMNPALQGDPPIQPIVQPVELLHPETGLPLQEIGLALAPALPSLTVGFGFTYILRARRRRKSREP